MSLSINTACPYAYNIKINQKYYHFKENMVEAKIHEIDIVKMMIILQRLVIFLINNND